MSRNYNLGDIFVRKTNVGNYYYMIVDILDDGRVYEVLDFNTGDYDFFTSWTLHSYSQVG